MNATLGFELGTRGDFGGRFLTAVDLHRLVDPSEGLSAEAWLDRIEDIAEDHGYFEPLGPDHSVTFIGRGRTLLVTFETIQSIRERAQSDVPLGWEMIAGTDWSQLCLLSDGETWFRHIAVYMYFDRLVDEGFFDEYDRVIFYGNESCGYAASAYSVAAPGACVLALSPQATLDPRDTEWDDRFIHMRRTSFTDRYGYAPDMLDAADRAFVLYDPAFLEDSMHAALFRRPNVTRIRCNHLDGKIETFLRRMGLLKPLFEIAATRNLEALDIYRALRERRDYLPYLRTLLNELARAGRPYLMALMCRSVLGRMNIPRFRQQYTRSLATLQQQGRSLPQQNQPEPA